MHPRRRSIPPWERYRPGRQHRRHPTGRTRRRWPRAYDGGAPRQFERRLNARYRRAFDGGRRSGLRRRYSSPHQQMRESPVRSGLIGLAVAGVAAPIAVNRYQEALRTDPSHERAVALAAEAHRAVDEAIVSEAWESMVDAQIDREAAIQDNLAKHGAYDLSRGLAETIYDTAVESDVDPDLAFNLVRAESSFRNTSTSPVGAIGLTQLMPRTAKWLEPGVTNQELRDERTNLRIGFKYLRQLMEKYDGDAKLALLAYNRGPGTVDKLLKRGKNPDNGYADFVFGNKNHGHKLFSHS